MAKTHKTCLECGARLADDAAQCDLCGEPVVPVDDAALPDPVETGTEPSEHTPSPAETAAAADRPAVASGIHCNQCGWKNPVRARFCSMCGSQLQEIDPAVMPVAPSPVDAPAQAPARASGPVEPPEEAPASEEKAAQAKADHKAVSRQVGIIVGAGVLLVVVLFLVTAVSKTRPAAAPTPTAQSASPEALEPGTLPPLPASVAARVDILENEMASLSGEDRIAKQRELVALFFNAQRLDRAALDQQQIAQVTNTAEDWQRAGDLFYDWMNPLQGPEKVQIAGQAVEAYQRVLALEPDNNDVRTDLATAYLSSNNPMQGVAEVKRVLDADSTHLQARFNYGIMLMMIGRSDRAIEQFERVKGLVGESSRYYREADEAIRSIRQGGSL